MVGACVITGETRVTGSEVFSVVVVVEEVNVVADALVEGAIVERVVVEVVRGFDGGEVVVVGSHVVVS